MTPVPDDARWTARLRGTLVVLAAAVLLDALDVSMVVVALPAIQAELGLSAATGQWLISGYVLGFGGLLLLGGRTADLLGRRRVFLAALAVFAAASLLSGLVEDGLPLLAARFLKGAAAAFTVPAGLSIITTAFAAGPVRNRALSVYTACGASGFSLGLVLSGLLTELGRRWVLLAPVPVALLALAAGLWLLPREPRPARPGRGYDLAGAATVTGGMLLLVYAVTAAPEAGWAAPRILLALALAAALLAAFVGIELRTRHPLVRLGILRRGPLLRANLGGITLFGADIGFQVVFMQYFQGLLGRPPLPTALAFLPAGLLVALSAPVVGRLIGRYGTPRLIVGGALALAAAFGLFLTFGTAPPPWLLPADMLLLGTGFAISFPALNLQATAGVADHEQGLAAGLVNTSFQVGGALVVAVVTAAATAGGGAVTFGGIRAAVMALLVVTGLGLLVAVSGLRRRPAAGRPCAGRRAAPGRA